jgi:ferrous iron transport protein A
MTPSWQKPWSPFTRGILSLTSMKSEIARAALDQDSSCAHALCPLNRVRAGIAVRVRQLCAAPALAARLREIGFCEDNIVKLLTSHNNIICLVCNTRLALSEQVAQTILVEPVGELVPA